MGESNGEAADVRVLAAVTRSMARKVENSGVVEQNSLKKTNAHATARLTDIEFIGEKGGAPGKLDEVAWLINKLRETVTQNILQRTEGRPAGPPF